MGYLWAQARLGYAVVLKGDPSTVRDILFETLNSFYEDGNREGVVFTKSQVASLFVAMSQFEKAAQLIGWSDSNLVGVRSVIDQAGVGHDVQRIEESDYQSEGHDAHEDN